MTTKQTKKIAPCTSTHSSKSSCVFIQPSQSIPDTPVDTCHGGTRGRDGGEGWGKGSLPGRETSASAGVWHSPGGPASEWQTQQGHNQGGIRRIMRLLPQIKYTYEYTSCLDGELNVSGLDIWCRLQYRAGCIPLNVDRCITPWTLI